MFALETYLYRTQPADLAYAEANLQALLPAAEIARIHQFKHPGARNSTLLARVLLRQLLARFGLGAPASIALTRSAHGKPALADGEGHFNVSHSGEYIVVAFASEPVGVDIEQQQARHASSGMAAHIMHEAEWLQYQGAADNARLEQFYRVWVLKEALLKWDGRGIAHGLKKVQVQTEPPAFVSHPALNACYLACPPGYCAALVTKLPLASLRQVPLASVFAVA